MILVVDASVAIKWFVGEEGWQAARDLLVTGRQLIAPDLIIPETCNIAWKKQRRGEIDANAAGAIAIEVAKAFAELSPSAELAEHAWKLAVSHDHSAYDCFYVALAGRRGAHLVTADARLLALAKKAGVSAADLGGA